MTAMNAVTMEIVATTLFGADVSGDIAEVADAMTVLQEETGNVRATAFFDLPEWIVQAARPEDSARPWRRSTASSTASSPSGAPPAKPGTTCFRCCWKRATRRLAKA